MRRLVLISLVACLGAAWLLTAVAGADDTHTYKIELDNAFGVVEGSELKVAGVTVGSITDLDVNEEKRAVVTVETSGPLATFGEDTTCSSEPQSLIAEYFLDCQPKGDPLPEGGTIPVEQTVQTVQPDLVQNTMREPFKRRLQLLINEFGTALAGNPENLNDAIRRGAPALRQFQEVLEILADQNRIIRDLNRDSDVIMARLAERREDVARFVREARDTAATSAERRADLSRNFEILDDFLAELRPTLADLGTLAREQTPLLRDLRVAAPGLNRLALNLPGFNASSEESLTSLGDAAVVGRRALTNGADEIRSLRAAGKGAPRTGELLADFLRDLDDPDRIAEIDARAAEDTKREAPTGYTGLEGLLNYVYYQTGALNQVDHVSHLLHFNLFSFDTGPCGHSSTGRDPETGDPQMPAKGGGTTTNPKKFHPCVSILGPNQPDITPGDQLNLPPYHPSVCPEGTEPEVAERELCNPQGDPEVSPTSTGGTRSGSAPAGGGTQQAGGGGDPSGPAPDLPSTVPGSPGEVQKGLEDLLGIGDKVSGLGKGGGLGKGLGGKSQKDKKGGGKGGSPQAADELMDFLFGN